MPRMVDGASGLGVSGETCIGQGCDILFAMIDDRLQMQAADWLVGGR